MRVVPLVVYIDGERKVIGDAEVSATGEVTARFASHEMADRLGFISPNHFSLGPSPDDRVQEDIKRLRRQAGPIFKDKR